MADSTQHNLERASRREDQIRELQDRIRELEPQLRAARSESERQQLQARIENIRVGINSLERLRGSEHGLSEPPAEFALALGSAHLTRGFGRRS